MKVVTLDLSSSAISKALDTMYTPLPFAVLYDTAPDDILRAARALPPRTWVFTFLTKPVDQFADYTPLFAGELGDIRDLRLVQPLWVGNFRAEDRESVAMQFVFKTLGTKFSAEAANGLVR